MLCYVNGMLSGGGGGHKSWKNDDKLWDEYADDVTIQISINTYLKSISTYAKKSHARIN